MGLFKKKKFWYSEKVNEDRLEETLTDIDEDFEIVAILPLEIKDKNDFIIIYKS